MTSVSTPATGTAGLGTMAGIEARRLARHPVFVVGVALAFGVAVLMNAVDEAPMLSDVIPTLVIPAFFIGLSSLVATARLTRSTEATTEAIGTAPGSEARRTAALAAACLVPFTAGALWVVGLLALAAARGVHPNEWWFATMPDWQLWSILIAGGPVACLGGGLLGLLTGRWLRFPGAPAVMVIAVVALDVVGQMGVPGRHSEARLWVPWAMFHSGSYPDGTSTLYAGNPLFYLGYLLCLCAAAGLVAAWHDRTARSRRLRAAIAATTVAGLTCLALAIATGPADDQSSEPVPFQVEQ